MKIVDDNWMYKQSTTGINRDVETITTGNTDSNYVKVVRCKDCKYRGKGLPYCAYFGETDFCSKAERKDTE